MGNNVMNYMIYRQILELLLEMLHQHGATLGLMAPGYPEQLGLPNGVGVASDGSPLYWALLRHRSREFRSQMELGLAIQRALDETCYRFCTDYRIRLQRLYNLPNDCLGLELVVGSWI